MVLPWLKSAKQRAISFPFVLFLSMLLFTIGIGFLAFVQRDMRLQVQAQRTNEVYILARSGLDFFSFHQVENPFFFPLGEAKGPFEVRPGYFFTITGIAGGGADCHAWIEVNGQRVAERTLSIPGNDVPGGDRRYIYDHDIVKMMDLASE